MHPPFGSPVDPTASFVLLVEAGTYRCQEGDWGTLDFVPGGPKGGYWSYSGGP
jgi:hypothetical protein